MKIKLPRKATIKSYDLVFEVASAIEASRFKAKVEVVDWRTINITMVRLRDTKAYCGSHPAMCELPGEKNKRRNFLEGADWVEFNDMINDALDGRMIEADVTTAVCVIRKGKKRRINYGSEPGPNSIPVWERVGHEGDYQDCTDGFRIVSTFPAGTPGVYSKTGYSHVG